MKDPSQMINRTYAMWLWNPLGPPAPALAPVAEELMGFQNPRSIFSTSRTKSGRKNWKGKKAADKRKKAADKRKKAAAAPGVVFTVGVTGYKPPSPNELQYQNRVKARRFYPKKKFSRFAPRAPRNTTSFIIRAKKSGGIASLVSPCPVTPAILPTPKFSPSTERLVDMAKEEWGVDGYGSMKGLIRLRSPTGDGRASSGGVEDEEDDDDGSSESDMEEHVEVEKRLDHDLSRFEIFYPSVGEDQAASTGPSYLLENRVDYQDSHIAQLEEENLTLKEKVFLMEWEVGELRRKLQLLETDYMSRNENVNNNNHGEENKLNSKEEATENDCGGEVCSEKRVGDNEENSGNIMEE